MAEGPNNIESIDEHVEYDETKEVLYKREEKKGIDWKYVRDNVFDFFKAPIIACIVMIILMKVIFLVSIVPSGSMETTIKTNSLMIANRLEYILKEPKRGDIIVFKSEETENPFLVKRVIGISGDVIDLKDGDVYLNGMKLDEEYVVAMTYPLNETTHFEVPENCVLVFGDNRENSLDSRNWNNPYVKNKDIIGKTICSVSFGSGKFSLF